jgi:hypothetical protein
MRLDRQQVERVGKIVGEYLLTDVGVLDEDVPTGLLVTLPRFYRQACVQMAADAEHLGVAQLHRFSHCANRGFESGWWAWLSPRASRIGFGVYPGIDADNRFMGVGDGGVSEGELAKLDGVGERPEYLIARPRAASQAALSIYAGALQHPRQRVISLLLDLAVRLRRQPAARCGVLGRRRPRRPAVRRAFARGSARRAHRPCA